MDFEREELLYFPETCSVHAIDSYFDGAYADGKIGVGFIAFYKSIDCARWQVLFTYAAASHGSSAMDAEALAATCLVETVREYIEDGKASAGILRRTKARHFQIQDP